MTKKKNSQQSFGQITKTVNAENSEISETLPTDLQIEEAVLSAAVEEAQLLLILAEVVSMAVRFKTILY